MNLPFTVEQFLGVFAQYNNAVWPAQIVLNALALYSLLRAIKPIEYSDKAIALILSFLWVWIGIVYHYLFFAPINPAAYGFAGIAVVQGILFLYYGVLKKSLHFRFRSDRYGITGSALIVYALLIYPLLGYFLGHLYPSSPTFGLPCPTTIFTFGMLLLTEKRLPVPVIVIPLLWSVIGFTAALKLGITEDIGLLVAGLAAGTLLFLRNRKLPT